MPLEEEKYKGKLLRLFRELMMLYNSHSGLSINQISEKLGVSYRTVYRDLEVLRVSGFVPEEITRGKFAIRGISREAERFQENLRFTSEEASVIATAFANIPAANPLRKKILEKLLTFSGTDDTLRFAIGKDLSAIMSRLTRAAREHQQVILRNYRSSHSASIRDRMVEPYGFSADGAFVKCYEPASVSNKTFKIERIGEVEFNGKKWENQSRHAGIRQADIFGIDTGKKFGVSLLLSVRAANLLEEEFPLSRPFISKAASGKYKFEANVRTFRGLGRFVLGLIDEIVVEGPMEFKDYLQEKIAQKRF